MELADRAAGEAPEEGAALLDSSGDDAAPRRKNALLRAVAAVRRLAHEEPLLFQTLAGAHKLRTQRAPALRYGV
jgi:hypothetical protein